MERANIPEAKWPKWMTVPILHIRNQLAYIAFNTLSADRPHTMGGVGMIPWTVMMTYCREYGITGLDQRELLLKLRCVDKAYVEHVNGSSE